MPIGSNSRGRDFVVGARNFAPEAERQNWTAGQALRVFESRLGLVRRGRSPYLAGEAEQAYLVRTSGRHAYQRAMETCQTTKAWLAEAHGQ